MFNFSFLIFLKISKYILNIITQFKLLLMRKFKAHWSLILVFCISINSAFSQIVVGYLDASLSQAASRMASLKWDQMTDCIYGFIQPDASGNLPDPTSLSHFTNFKTYCNNNGVKMHFSSGGATYSSIFETIGNNVTARQNFAKEIADIMQTHGIVGFDLDWEFPTSQSARTAHVNILKAVHDEFVARGKRDEWEIAIAVGGETPSVGAQGVYHTDYCSPDAFQYIDHLNLMSYDIGYGISGNDPNHSSYADAVNNVVDWVAKGCPIEKIVLGVPFYARHQSNRGAAIYTHAYSNLSAGNPSAAFNSNNVGEYYYNGKQTLIDKVNYIMNAGGSGIMIWEVTYDRTDEYSLLKVIADAMLPYQCSAPKPNLGNNQSICGLTQVTLNGNIPTANGRTFTWKRGNTTLVNLSSTATTYNATQDGIYTLEVHENGCFQSDEVEITANLGTIDLGGPYELCKPVSVTLNTGMDAAGKSFVWRKDGNIIENATGTSYMAKRAGTYQISVSATGCSSIQASATVTSKAPFADDVLVCSANGVANMQASEVVNWYATEQSSTILATSDQYDYQTVGTQGTTLWMGGTGAQATEYATLKSDFSGGWQADAQVYATKLDILTDVTLNAVTVHPSGGNLKINLVGSNGTTVVHTKTFNNVSTKQEFALNWTVAPGTYYLNCVGTTGNVWVDNSLPAQDFSIPGVLTSVKNCFQDWSAPYGDAYVAATNYGNFANLKLTSGTACDRVPVTVTVNPNHSSCLITNSINLNGIEVKIFPNPSSTNFQLQFNGLAQVSVFGVNGQLVQTFNHVGNSVFGNDLKPGLYFVQVVNNNKTANFKVVKN